MTAPRSQPYQDNTGGKLSSRGSSRKRSLGLPRGPPPIAIIVRPYKAARLRFYFHCVSSGSHQIFL